MPAASRNPVTELLIKIHPWIYRVSGGRILGSMGGTPILLLTSIGHKSGEPRTNALMYLDRGERWVVAGSWAGEPKHPFWYLNLKKSPDATLQIGRRVVAVRAREAIGEERNRLWQETVEQDPSFAVYEERTRGIREIPMIVFEPR
jgi:deazaflavin-dependent oxidoreductase (nitroreductase family)